MIFLRFIIILCLLAMPAHAAPAASLTAIVDDESIAVGEPLTLQLTLSGAEAKEDPDLSPLAGDFTIAEQGRSSETSIVNGHMTSSMGWQIVLLPRHDGHVTIPALHVLTDAGILSSQPLALTANGAPAHASGHTPAAAPGPAISLTASAATTTPYRDQPVLYTLRAVAHASVSDIAPGDIKADNAIVTMQGRPDIRDGVDHGDQVKIVEFHYLVTPVRPGPLTIGPVSLQGRVEIQSPMPQLRSRHPGMIDPFDLMQSMGGFPGMTEMRPFTVTSNPVTLDVRAPVAGVEPWLPLKNLELKEQIDLDGPFRVGEPIVRRLTMDAQGLGGDQLPDLAARNTTPALKTYGDKPVTQTTVVNDEVEGSRSENLNLIPTVAGTVELPAVKVQWYDIAHDKVMTAEAPAHSVTVLPAAIALPSGAPQAAMTPTGAEPAAGAAPAVPPPPAPMTTSWSGLPAWLWPVGGAGLLVALYLAYRLGRGTRRASEADAPAPGLGVTPMTTRPPVMDWSALTTPALLQAALIAYARARWDLTAHGDLGASFAAGSALSDDERAAGLAALRDLDGALYGGQATDVAALKSRLKNAVSARDRTVRERHNRNRLPPLNPL